MPLDTPRTEPTLTEVVAGIVADLQKLFAQQTALLKAEVTHNWDKATQALQPIVAGAILGGTGVVLLGITAALLLHWTLSPVGVDPARMPLWACFGIAASAFLVIGAALVGMGVKQLESVHAMPKASAEEFEKNVAAVVDVGRPAA